MADEKQFCSPWNGTKKPGEQPTSTGIIRSPNSTPGSTTGDRKSPGVHRDPNAKR